MSTGDRMRVLIVGNGGREHAIAQKVRQSPQVDAVYGTRPNAGMRRDVIDCGIGADDSEGLCRFAVEGQIGLVVVGPEAPLAAGLADRLQAVGVPVLGPVAAAAELCRGGRASSLPPSVG